MSRCTLTACSTPSAAAQSALHHVYQATCLLAQMLRQTADVALSHGSHACAQRDYMVAGAKAAALYLDCGLGPVKFYGDVPHYGSPLMAPVCTVVGYMKPGPVGLPILVLSPSAWSGARRRRQRACARGRIRRWWPQLATLMGASR